MSEVLHRPETAAATIASINPATEVELARFDLYSPADIDGALTAAVKAQAAWREVPITERVKLLRRKAEVLRAGRAKYAELITREMGKPLPEAEGEIEKCAWDRIVSRRVVYQRRYWAALNCLSGCQCWQADERIIAERRDGFQRHVARTLNGPLIMLLE